MDYDNFITTFRAMQGAVHQCAVDHGWWDTERNDGEMIALMHSERILADMYAALSTISPAVAWPIDGVSPEWAAGFIDGEGHFGINKHVRKVNGRPQYLTRSQIGNTEKDLLEPFLAFGGLLTKVESSRWNKNAAVCYKWTIHNREAQRFALAVLPYLKNKRKIEAAKTILKLEFLRKRAGGNKLDPVRVMQQEFYYQEILRINKRGPSLEYIRHGNPPDDKCPEFDGAVVEFADVIIRIMDTCHQRGWPLAEAILAKHDVNVNRPYKHGGKQF